MTHTRLGTFNTDLTVSILRTEGSHLCRTAAVSVELDL